MKESEDNLNLKIPKIIHQTYKTDRIPGEFVDYRKSWIQNHPDWEYRLWTDYENRLFIKNNYEWFLPVYDRYPEKIMRIDAVRYFILDYFGGLYVDLDFESLKNIEPLLHEKEIVFGQEPVAHTTYNRAKKRGLKRIISNAFMASTPDNRFWKYLFQELVKSKNKTGVLDATGPFFLSGTVEKYENKEDLEIISPELIYPINNQENWKQYCREKSYEIQNTGNIYAVHHWRGSWIKNRKKRHLPLKRIFFNLGRKLIKKTEYFLDRQNSKDINLDRSFISDNWKISDSPDNNLHLKYFNKGNKIFEGFSIKETILTQSSDYSAKPLVSCLMVTKNRFELAKTAVDSFLNQTYPEKELVIIDDGECGKLHNWVESLAKHEIVYIKLKPENRVLGELRNISIQNCSGEYVTQWDDDDFSHPERLNIQISLIYIYNADACFLSRHQVILPSERKIFYSSSRIWEGSFLARKENVPEYPVLSRGEDTPVMEKLFESTRSIFINYPSLYTYIYHKQNTFGFNHFDKFLKSAVEVFKGELFYQKLDKILDENLVDKSEFYARHELDEEKRETKKPYIKKKYPSKNRTEFPEILILTPAKNAEHNLPLYFSNLKKLTYPHDKISIGILESDSEDRTYEMLKEMEEEISKSFKSFLIYKHNFNYRTKSGHRWNPLVQFERRANIAKSRNILLSKALTTEQWVLWIDIDLLDWPENIIEIFLDTEKSIVVPSCVNLNGEVFDMNTFRFNNKTLFINWKDHIINGILQSPFGLGRNFLSNLRDYSCIEVDSVGGTMLFINADIHREGLVFPPYSYKYFIETEGLAMMAKDMGYKCWGLPGIEVVHCRD